MRRTRGGPGGRGRRALRAVAAAVLALAVLAGALAVWSVLRAWPEQDGTVVLDILDGPVTVERDAFGVPAIRGTTSADLQRAQGYVHAQERFWQMDVFRHVAAGRTAELFGPEQLPTDRFLRTLGWRRVAEQEVGLLDPDARAALEHYAEGVNAYLEERPHRALGLEYTVLGLRVPGYRPEPWEPADSLAFLKVMAWDLRSNLEEELERGILRPALGDERLAELFPIADGPTILPGGPVEPGPAPEAAEAAAGAAGALAEVRDAVAAVDALLGRPRGADGVGSNSWVISGARSATGGPILANDPHLPIRLPSIWYQVGLRCEARTRSCLDDVAGFSLPGVPGVVIGHNDRIAWGFTNLAPDVMDLYVERLDPDDPARYEVDGEYRPFTVRTEELRASDGTVETITVRSTRHGPVVSEVYEPLEDYAPQTVEGPYVVALRWTALEPGRTFEALPALNRADDWESFREAARLFEVPAQNMVYADVDGSIGYQAPGRIPVRTSGDGRIPVPGWNSSAEWTGYVPFEDLPNVRDPEAGFLVTANNVVSSDPAALITTDWDQGYRAARITEILGRSGGVTLDDVQELQGDVVDPAARQIVPAVIALPGGGEPVDVARGLFTGWDARAGVDSPAAALSAATWRALLARTFHDELPEEAWPGASSRWITVVDRLLDDPDNAWWDDVDTNEVVEDRDAVLTAAVTEAVAELRARLDEEPSRWRWGDLHRAEFRNGPLGESGIPVLERLFNRGSTRVGGGTSVVNATAWDPAAGYEVVALPSLRMIVDLGDFDRSRAIHTTGQSGHVFHPDYTSMTSRWAANQQLPFPWTSAALAPDVAGTLRLEPSS